jgi:hypothetical protein
LIILKVSSTFSFYRPGPNSRRSNGRVSSKEAGKTPGVRQPFGIISFYGLDNQPTPTTGIAVLRETASFGVASAVTFGNLTGSLPGSRVLRQLLNSQFNNLSITLGGSPGFTFTIPTAGTYLFRARALYAFARSAGSQNPSQTSSKLFINNQTITQTDWLVGESCRSMFHETSNVLGNTMNYSVELTGVNTITANTVLSLEQQVNNINSTNTANGGQASSVGGQTEVYATLEIQRIA